MLLNDRQSELGLTHERNNMTQMSTNILANNQFQTKLKLFVGVTLNSITIKKGLKILAMMLSMKKV